MLLLPSFLAVVIGLALSSRLDLEQEQKCERSKWSGVNSVVLNLGMQLLSLIQCVCHNHFMTVLPR